MMHHIVYTVDNSVFEPLLRSMQSLALHLSKPDQCTINLIVPRADFPKASSLVARFRSAVGHCRAPAVELHEVRPLPFQADYPDRTDLKGHTVAFARLFLPEYLPDVGRAIYIDADTLIMGDLMPLLDVHMEHPLAAVSEGTSFADLWGKWYADLYTQVPDARDRSIFNDGVLVLDLDRWRAEGIVNDLKQWVQSAGASIDDQLPLNLEFQVKKGFDVLDHEWNDFRVRSTGWPNFGWSDELSPDDPISHAKIIHWTGPKPWNTHFREQWMQQYRYLWEPAGFNSTKTNCSPARSTT